MNTNLNINSDIKNTFSKALSEVDNNQDLDYEARMIMYRFLSEIERTSEAKNINRKELASLIGTSASYITQLFRGSKLINLMTIAKFQKIFDLTFEVKAIPNKAKDGYLDMDLTNLSNETRNDQGFWTFHKFKPAYDHSLTPIESLEKNFEKRTA